VSNISESQNSGRPYILSQLDGFATVLPPFPSREHLASIFPPKMTQRLIASGWLEKLPMGSRETRFSLKSVLAAIDRISAGEQPPRLPSEPVPTGKRHIPGHSPAPLYALAA
jgi:hypothetical protein